MHEITRKQNCPEGFTYTRCNGSIFEDIPGESIYDNNNNSLAADDIDVHLDDNNDNIIIEDEEGHEDVEDEEVHENVENEENNNNIDGLDKDVDALQDDMHIDIDNIRNNDGNTV